MEPTPFHVGELEVQKRMGVHDHVASYARRFIRPAMPDQHRDFYDKLPFAVAAVRGSEGQPWATILAGKPGFMQSPNPTTLAFERLPDSADPALEGLVEGADIGLLGIELHTRRRNRVNGSVHRNSTGGFELKVAQSFGNCPKHIRERGWRPQEPEHSGVAPEIRTDLSAEQRRWIDGADTFFTATGFRGDGVSETFGMDASHRGGQPGFVRAVGPTTVVWGDYAGNNHFNTLGNLELDPRAGLTFVDFETGGLLQLTGTATVDWDPAAREGFLGAERLVKFEITRVVARQRALPIVWDSTPADRELTVVAVHDESEGVKSFFLTPTDGEALSEFKPGQYLPITLSPRGRNGSVERTYSLSGPPNAAAYRITVKREPHGLGSQTLHDHVKQGSIIRASLPRGEFVLPPGQGTVILAGAGVGVTPFASMVQTLAGGSRRVVLVHGVRSRAHHLLKDEMDAVAAAANIEVYTRYSRPEPGDVAAGTNSAEGRIDAELLHRLAKGDAADYFVCGPSGFMAELIGGLELLGVDRLRIHEESFG